MKETIERILNKLFTTSDDGGETIEKILTEELSTINPMRIDEERMESILIGIGGDNYYKNNVRKAFRLYNSTIKDHQALQPLPSDMPEWFGSLGRTKGVLTIWKELVSNYGTPTKKEIVSVEELKKELEELTPATIGAMAFYLVNTYSLNTPKREWWMDLKEGEWYKDHGNRKSVFSHVALISTNGGISNIQNCTPYIEPSIHDKFMASLSDEQKKMYEQLKEAKK